MKVNKENQSQFNQLYCDYRTYKRLCYVLDNGLNDIDLKNKQLMLLNEINTLSDETIKQFDKLFNARRSRVYRLKSRIKYAFILNQYCFITLTFEDKVLNVTSKETRRKYVSRFLKSLNYPYVANIDYGKKNEREHYHAILLCDIKSINKSILNKTTKKGLKMSLKTWIYGHSNVEKYNKDKSNLSALCKYLDKTSNHAFKNQKGQTERLIYSKDFDKRCEFFKSIVVSQNCEL